MSSNRLIYDECAYSTNLNSSKSQLEYNLLVDKFVLAKDCPVGDYPNILKFDDRTDVENELYGLSRLNTKCPEYKYKAESEFNNPKLSVPRLCESIHYITPSNIDRNITNMLPNQENSLLSGDKEQFSNLLPEDEDSFSYCYGMIDNMNLGVNTCSSKNGNETKNIEGFADTRSETRMKSESNTHMKSESNTHMKSENETHMKSENETHIKKCDNDSILGVKDKCVKCNLPLSCKS
jgi:hypothetical protein